MLYKFIETKTYYIEADTEEEAHDKFLNLYEGEVSVELVSSERGRVIQLHDSFSL